jgi:hypothetical protein
MKKILTLFLIIIICSSCSTEGLQVNERAFVQLFGMKKTGSIYHVYMKLLEEETISGEGDTILSAVAEAELLQGKKLFLGQMKLFIIGDGFEELSRDLNLFISGDICPACPVLYSDNPEEIVGSEVDADELLKELNVYSSQGKSIITPLTEIVSKTTENRTASTVPNVSQKDDRIEFDGITLLGEDGSKGIISNSEALGIKILSGKTESRDRITISAPVGIDTISSEILGLKVKRDVRLKDNILTLQIKIKIKADITEKPTKMPYEIGMEAISDYVSRTVLETYNLTLKGYNIDTIGLGKLVRQKLSSDYEVYKQNPTLYWENSVIEIITETE